MFYIGTLNVRSNQLVSSREQVSGEPPQLPRSEGVKSAGLDMGRRCVDVTVCAVLLLLVHSTQGSESGSSESTDVTSTEYWSDQKAHRNSSQPEVSVSSRIEDESKAVPTKDALHGVLDESSTESNADGAALDDRNKSSAVAPLTTEDLVSPKELAESTHSKDVYFVDGVSDKEPVAFVGAQLQRSPLSDSLQSSNNDEQQRLEEQQQQPRETSELVLGTDDAHRLSRENETRVTENVENAPNENRNSSSVQAERDQTQDAIWAQQNLKTTSFPTDRNQEPSLGANTRAGAETGAVAIPVMHFGGQRFIEFGVVRTPKGPQVLKNHILTRVVIPGGLNDTRKITNLLRSGDPPGASDQALVPLISTIEDDPSSTEKAYDVDASGPAAAHSPSESSVSDSSSSTSQETSSSSSESSEFFSEDGKAGCKDRPRRKRKVTKPKPVPASLASVFEFKRLSKKKPSPNSLLPKTLAETRATESSEDGSFDSSAVTPDTGSYSLINNGHLDADRRSKSVGTNDDFLQNVLRNFGVQVEVVPASNSTNSTVNESTMQKVETFGTTPLPGSTVALLPIIPPVQSLSRMPETDDIIYGPTNSLLKSKPPRVQIKVSEEELAVPAVKSNSKNRSNAKAAAVNSLGHEVSDGEKSFTSSTKSSRQGFEVPTLPPIGAAPSPIPKPPTETFTIDLSKLRENKRKTNKPKGGSVELTPGKVYIHDLESATFEEAPDEDGTLARNLEARKKYEDDFVKNILQNYGVQVDSKDGKAKSEFVSPDSRVQTSLPAPPVDQQTNAAPPSPPLLTIRPPPSKEPLPQLPVFLHEPQKQQNLGTLPVTSSELPLLSNMALSGSSEIFGPREGGPSRAPAQQADAVFPALRSQFLGTNEAIRVVPAPNLAGLQPPSPVHQHLYAPNGVPLVLQLQQPPSAQALQSKQQPLTSATTQVKQEPQYESAKATAPQQLLLGTERKSQSNSDQVAQSQAVNQLPEQAILQSQDVSSQNLRENREPFQQQAYQRSPSIDPQQGPAPQPPSQAPATGANVPGSGSIEQGPREQQAPISAQVPSGQELFHPHVRIVEKHPIYQGQQILNNQIHLLQPQLQQSGYQIQLQPQKQIQQQIGIQRQQQQQLEIQQQQQLEIQQRRQQQLEIQQQQQQQQQLEIQQQQQQQQQLEIQQQQQQQQLEIEQQQHQQLEIQQQQQQQLGIQQQQQQQQLEIQQQQQQQPETQRQQLGIQRQQLEIQQQQQQQQQLEIQQQHQQQLEIQQQHQQQPGEQQQQPEIRQQQLGTQQQQQQEQLEIQQHPNQQEQPRVAQTGEQVQVQQQQVIVQGGEQIQFHQQQIIHGDVQVQNRVIHNQQPPAPEQPQLVGAQLPNNPEPHVHYLPKQQPIDPQLQGQPTPQSHDPQGQSVQFLSPADIPVEQQLKVGQPQYEPIPSSDTQSSGLSRPNHAEAQQQLHNLGTSSQADQLLQQQHLSQQQHHQQSQHLQLEVPLQQHRIPAQPQEHNQQQHVEFQLVREQQSGQLPDQRGAQLQDSREDQPQQPRVIQLQQQLEVQGQQQRDLQLQQQQLEIQLRQQQQEIQLQQHHQQAGLLRQQPQQVQLPHHQISIQDPQLPIQNQLPPQQQISQYQSSQLSLPQITPQPNLFRAAHSVATFPSSQAITVPTFEVENGQLRRVPVYTGRTRQLRLGPGFVTRGQFRPLPLKTGTGSTQTAALPFGGFQVTHFAPGTGATAQSTYQPDKNGLLSNVFSQSFNPVEGTSSTFRLNFGYRSRDNQLPNFSNGEHFDRLFAQIPSGQRARGLEFLDSQKKTAFSGNPFNNQRSYVLGSGGSLVSNVDLQSNGPNEYTGYIKKASRRKSR